MKRLIIASILFVIAVAITIVAKEQKKESNKELGKVLPMIDEDKKYSDSELIEMKKKGIILSCDKYHYSICPSNCKMVCTSSVCPPGGPCTADCDGPESCVEN